MTTRERINRRLWQAYVISATGVACYIIGVVVGNLLAMPWLMAVGVAGFLVVCVGEVYAVFPAFRCPQCAGYLGMIARRDQRWSMHKRVRFCPYCRLDLDLAVTDFGVGGSPSKPSQRGRNEEVL